ncbi:metal-dependent hydrolase [Halodesulfurarchaeum sp.]|uniref:metal-dependent hydrolase n=1 Tax=Halodesulfurarchaeum sp. TaxID=1980530 RepID=UPI001BC6D6C1|nr:metal-dependent hydrolase [Halodesulfurarchaeum sp.]
MPSTLVHVAIGGIVAVALLRDEFGWWSLGVVMAFAAVPDLDTFVGLVLPGAHRSLFHSVFVPLGLGGLLVADGRRNRSLLIDRFGPPARRIAGVGVVALVLGGIGPDLVTNGVNLLYPVQDNFLTVSGELRLSDQRGIVQTFIDRSQPDAGGAVVGSTETVHYSTGVDPSPGTEPEQVKRVFPLLGSGMQLLIVGLSATLIGGRFLQPSD